MEPNDVQINIVPTDPPSAPSQETNLPLEEDEDMEMLKTAQMDLFGEHYVGYKLEREKDEKVTAGKLGWLGGVYVPCCMNILGILLFIRLGWIVGQAGIGLAVLLVFLSCCCTFLTTMSMSAIATNGRVQAGGSYYLISRYLGAQFGGAVGILFYLATTVAASMYILGFCESLQNTIPGLKMTEDWDRQILGIIVLIMLVMYTCLGVKWVARIGILFILGVLAAVLGCYLGVFITRDWIRGIGISGYTFVDNFAPNFDKGQSFFTMLALFFPSVTGLMAGANRSRDLRDAQRAIPRGTLAAVATTSVIYISCTVLFGMVATRYDLKNDFFIIMKIAWPTEYVVRVGVLVCSVGAALQCLTGAPRLLQAIAMDRVVPLLHIFAPGAEARRAMIPTVIIVFGCVMTGNLDYIAPIITMFFLLCYASINLACFVLAFIKAPNFRPRYRFFHWITAGIGLLFCVTFMFMINWYIALISIFVAFLIYKAIEWRGLAADWGDGLKGLRYQNARNSLLALEPFPIHTKNWRPQVLALIRFQAESDEPVHPGLLLFVRQLKAGQGLAIFASFTSGKLRDVYRKTKQNEVTLKKLLQQYGIPGFTESIAAANFREGVTSLAQCSGLGRLRPNLVLLGWPSHYKENWANAEIFVEMIKDLHALQKAVVLARNIDEFPQKEKQKGTIDIWWIVHDGGLLLLLPFLLMRNKVWKGCKLRIFSVADAEDNSIQMEKDIKEYLYSLRIEAEVQIVEMDANEISPYTHQRTLLLEERMQLVQKLVSRTRRHSVSDMSQIAQAAHRRSSMALGSPHTAAARLQSLFVPPTARELEELHTRTHIDTISDTPTATATPTHTLSPLSQLFVPPTETTTQHTHSTTITPQPMRREIGQGVGSEDEHAEDDHRDKDKEPAQPTQGPPHNPSSSSSPPSPSPSVEMEMEAGGSSGRSGEGVGMGMGAGVSPSYPGTPPRQERGELYETCVPPCTPDTQAQTQAQGRAEAVMMMQQTPTITVTGEVAPASPERMPPQDSRSRMQIVNMALRMNEVIRQRSSEASLVFINLPPPRKLGSSGYEYLEYLDILTESLRRVIMIRGTGAEVVTIYS
eukprot:gnl/Trimastix_PCT/3704.p1 GENE.gnl/Trimastix_PCT/3704~~gnl/Trimastix_PCT/3704.p1  ORF type:complete len:1089 (+),score=198.39 gnl/Trimastix_PCT/3704:48-3314(+)